MIDIPYIKVIRIPRYNITYIAELKCKTLVKLTDKNIEEVIRRSKNGKIKDKKDKARNI